MSGRCLHEGEAWYVEVPYKGLALRYGPYPRRADAEATRQRVSAALRLEREPWRRPAAPRRRAPRPTQERLAGF